MTPEDLIDTLTTDEKSRQNLKILAAFMLAQKDVEIVKSHYIGEINALTTSMLQISGKCTSRGIFEYVLKGCQTEHEGNLQC